MEYLFPSYEGGGFDLSRTTHIQIVVDLAAIKKDDLIAWLIGRTRLYKGDHKIKINRRRIPVNNPEIVKLLTQEIEDE